MDLRKKILKALGILGILGAIITLGGYAAGLLILEREGDGYALDLNKLEGMFWTHLDKHEECK